VMNLEDSADAVTDHRIALMQKWAADPKLMAQMGLSAKTEAHEHMYLAGMKPDEILKRRQESKENRHAAITNAATAAVSQSHKPNKKHRKQHKELIETLKKLTTRKPQKHNGHLTSKETVEELDSKVEAHLTKYKTELDTANKDIESIVAMMPSNTIFAPIKSYVANANSSFLRFSSGKQSFDEVYIQIANGLYKYVVNTSSLKKINHKYAYPSFYFWQPQMLALQKGFIVHEILSMLLVFLQRNSSHEKISHIKDQTHDIIHVVSRYKHRLDKNYTQLMNLKQALDAKGKAERKADIRVSHKHLKHIKADIEESLHDEGTFFKMGQPYEES
jgi:hypothetical protein